MILSWAKSGSPVAPGHLHKTGNTCIYIFAVQIFCHLTPFFILNGVVTTKEVCRAELDISTCGINL